MMKKKIKIKAKKKEIIMNNDEACSSSSSSSTSNPNSTLRVSRVARRSRNHTVRLGMARRTVGERQAEALALPLGMSIAAFANLISASAVKESLANVYGDKLGSFATNFERSFKSTLRILKLTNGYSFQHQLNNNNLASFSLNSSSVEGCSDTELSAKEASSSATPAYEAIEDGARTKTSSMNEIVLHEETRQVLSSVPRSSAMSSLTAIDRFLEEQARANDLKTMENCLTSRKLSLKETELALSCESNNLERSKLEMGASKAAFKEEKFRTESEDKRKADMASKIMDSLFGSLFSMVVAMSYGAFVFSQEKIKEATKACEPSEEKTSPWWVSQQVSWINAEYNILICRVRVWAQSFIGFAMIFLLACFLIKRSSSANQTMPVTFIVLCLGVVCGLFGKFCVDNLGGNGKLWLYLWEMFCLLQLVANVFAVALYGLINGPISVTQGTNSSRRNTKVPYWARQSFFYVVIMLVFPVIIGLLPFATFGEWIDYFTG